jgi:hypothetical protein
LLLVHENRKVDRVRSGFGELATTTHVSTAPLDACLRAAATSGGAAGSLEVLSDVLVVRQRQGSLQAGDAPGDLAEVEEYDAEVGPRHGEVRSDGRRGFEGPTCLVELPCFSVQDALETQEVRLLRFECEPVRDGALGVLDVAELEEQ